MAVVAFALALPFSLLVARLALALLRSPGVSASDAASQPAPAGNWPSVDVIVPARNEAARLPALLASLTAQDYPGPLRLIVVDDRSDDDSAALVQAAADRDARVELVQVHSPSRRMAPKVNAVAHGIAHGNGAWIVTTDADCVHPRAWLRALIGAADERDVMVSGYVETARPGARLGLLGSVEALDWASLMLVNRALRRLGLPVASSANNQAYRRDAFERIGGFGVAGRAPSGDEDLLAQRLGALPGARTRFVDAPEARVLTEATGRWGAFLRQRRRWVSRFHHPQQYHPGFLAGIVLLGGHSTALALATLTAPVAPAGLGWLAAAWLVTLGSVLLGMDIGLRRVGRRDLAGWPLVAWALMHPFYIASVSLWSFVRPGSWRAGAASYRRRWWRVVLRRVQRT